jgi:hypothetical protein
MRRVMRQEGESPEALEEGLSRWSMTDTKQYVIDSTLVVALVVFSSRCFISRHERIQIISIIKASLVLNSRVYSLLTTSFNLVPYGIAPCVWTMIHNVVHWMLIIDDEGGLLPTDLK